MTFEIVICGPYRDELRTFASIFEGLTALNTTGRLPDLITLMGGFNSERRDDLLP